MGSGRGIKNFQRIAGLVQGRLNELTEKKNAVNEALSFLISNTSRLINLLAQLQSSIKKSQKKTLISQSTGVFLTAFGTLLAAIFWTYEYDSSITYLATGIGILGTIIKVGNSYLNSRRNSRHLQKLENLGKNFSEAEKILNVKFADMVHLLKDLYSQPEEIPTLVTAMETADMAGCAPDVISTVLDYSSQFGIESLEGFTETYEAATTSIGEAIGVGVLEGAANGLSIVLSGYEVYKLVHQWDQKHPTYEKVQDLIDQVNQKLKVYKETKKCMDVIEVLRKSVGLHLK